MFRTTIVLSALALGTGAAAAVEDPARYGGGACHEMAQRHDPSTLYVGRFAASYDEGHTGPSSEVACFTDHRQCMRWVDRDAGGNVIHIYQMSCHRGL